MCRVCCERNQLLWWTKQTIITHLYGSWWLCGEFKHLSACCWRLSLQFNWVHFQQIMMLLSHFTWKCPFYDHLSHICLQLHLLVVPELLSTGVYSACDGYIWLFCDSDNSLQLSVLRLYWHHPKLPLFLKVVEIAPAIQLDPQLRDRLHADAVNLARQVGLYDYWWHVTSVLSPLPKNSGQIYHYIAKKKNNLK